MSAPYEITLISQPNAKLCAVACGAMMWAWRSVEKGGQVPNLGGILGPYLATGVGQSEDELSGFYARFSLIQLGGAKSKVPGIQRATGANVRYALKWSPVIVLLDPQRDQITGHVVVVAGHQGDTYTIANPSGTKTLNFGGQDSDEAAFTTMQTGALDRTMGRCIWYWG